MYDAIIGVNNTSGNLQILQEFLDSQNPSNAEKMTAINEENSEVDNSYNRINFNNSDLSASIIFNRLGALRQGAAGISSGDETVTKSSWIELFGSLVNQGNTGSYEGYDAKTSGITFGFDKNFADKNIIAGLALTLASSHVNSTSIPISSKPALGLSCKKNICKKII